MSSGSWKGWLATVLPSGGPAYPFTAPAVRIKAKPRDDVYLQAAVFSGDPAEFDGSNQPRVLPTGTIFSFRGGMSVESCERGRVPMVTSRTAEAT